MKEFVYVPYWIAFSFFVAVKMAGHALAAWSWWWILMPLIPDLGLLVQRWGL